MHAQTFISESDQSNIIQLQLEIIKCIFSLFDFMFVYFSIFEFKRIYQL